MFRTIFVLKFRKTLVTGARIETFVQTDGTRAAAESPPRTGARIETRAIELGRVDCRVAPSHGGGGGMRHETAKRGSIRAARTCGAKATEGPDEPSPE